MRKAQASQSSKQKTILSLFVGGLPSVVTEESIHSGFERFGEIQSIKVAKNKKSQLSKGYAYVYLKTSATLEEIIQSRVVIQDREVDVQIASTKSEKKTHGSINNQRKIFVGNLPGESTGEHLQELFQKFGEIVRAYIIYDFFSKESKGYGYVEFKESSSASKALKSSLMIGGNTISILPYVSKNEKRRSKVLEEPSHSKNLDYEDAQEDHFASLNKDFGKDSPSSFDSKEPNSQAGSGCHDSHSRPTMIGSFSQKSEAKIKPETQKGLLVRTQRFEGHKKAELSDEPSSPDIVERSGFIIKGPVPKLPQTTKSTKALILDAAKQLNHAEKNYRFSRNQMRVGYPVFPSGGQMNAPPSFMRVVGPARSYTAGFVPQGTPFGSSAPTFYSLWSTPHH